LIKSLIATVTTNFTENINAIVPEKILVGSSLVINLNLNQNEDIVDISVIMNENDITSSAYNSSTKQIIITNVTGDISISALADEIIQFEDSAVKTICVNNWGGSVVEGEITASEAA